MSRRKGTKAEYQLRDYLLEHGYEAVRVPLSGASEGYKGDVVATKDGIKYTFEMKARKCLFKTIYRDYYRYKEKGGPWRFTYDGVCVAVGSQFDEVRTPKGIFLSDPDPKIPKRLLKMRKDWLQDCDYLVLKDNHMHMLFIRYWG